MFYEFIKVRGKCILNMAYLQITILSIFWSCEHYIYAVS